MGPGAGYEGRGSDNPNTHKHLTFKTKLAKSRITCVKITWLFVCCTLQCFFKQKWKGQWFYHYFYFYIATLRCLGYPAPSPRPSYLALGSWPPAPQKFSTTSTSSYLKSSHYDHDVHITFNGLRVMLILLMSYVHVLKKLSYRLMYT